MSGASKLLLSNPPNIWTMIDLKPITFNLTRAASASPAVLTYYFIGAASESSQRHQHSVSFEQGFFTQETTELWATNTLVQGDLPSTMYVRMRHISGSWPQTFETGAFNTWYVVTVGSTSGKLQLIISASSTISSSQTGSFVGTFAIDFAGSNLVPFQTVSVSANVSIT